MEYNNIDLYVRIPYYLKHEVSIYFADCSLIRASQNKLDHLNGQLSFLHTESQSAYAHLIKLITSHFSVHLPWQ